MTIAPERPKVSRETTVADVLRKAADIKEQYSHQRGCFYNRDAELEKAGYSCRPVMSTVTHVCMAAAIGIAADWDQDLRVQAEQEFQQIFYTDICGYNNTHEKDECVSALRRTAGMAEARASL